MHVSYLLSRMLFYPKHIAIVLWLVANVCQGDRLLISLDADALLLEGVILHVSVRCAQEVPADFGTVIELGDLLLKLHRNPFEHLVIEFKRIEGLKLLIPMADQLLDALPPIFGLFDGLLQEGGLLD